MTRTAKSAALGIFVAAISGAYAAELSPEAAKIEWYEHQNHDQDDCQPLGNMTVKGTGATEEAAYSSAMVQIKERTAHEQHGDTAVVTNLDPAPGSLTMTARAYICFPK